MSSSESDRYVLYNSGSDVLNHGVLADFMVDFITNPKKSLLIPTCDLKGLGKINKNRLRFINALGLSNNSDTNDLTLITSAAFMIIWDMKKFNQEQSFHRIIDGKSVFYFGIGGRERIIIESFNISFGNHFYVEIPITSNLRLNCLTFINSVVRFCSQMKKYLFARKLSTLGAGKFTMTAPPENHWKMKVVFDNAAHLAFKKLTTKKKYNEVSYIFVNDFFE